MSKKKIFLLLFVVGISAAFIFIKTNPAAQKAFIFLVYKSFPDYPRNTDKEIQMKGLTEKASVTFDRFGVPHIKAKNDLDLLRVIGFIHAKERFFQMDILRRVALGRMSEMVGERPFLTSTTVKFDRAMRGWGFERNALKDWKKLPEAEKKLSEAYSDGVNQALKKFKPIEYRLLGIEPEPWSSKDILAVGLLNAWSISHNWQQELVRFLLTSEVGIKRAGKIYHHDPLPGGESLPGETPKRQLLPGIPPELESLFPGRPYKKASLKPYRPSHLAKSTINWLGAASNAWVVNGQRSKSGKPLLANDPHMSHILPSLLIQQHLKTPDLDVIGATWPGFPFILMGHNKNVAWGMTSAVADAIDLVIEKPHPKHKDQVLNENGICALTQEQIEIKARTKKGMKSYKFTLRRSCRGPLINDLYPELFSPKDPMIAVQWDLRGVSHSIKQFQKINRAKSVAHLKSMMQQITTPVSTCQAADTKGNIGIFWAGMVPKRDYHRGTFPFPGWLTKYQWNKKVPAQNIASGMNPQSGLYAHANNLLIDPHQSFHPGHIDSAPSYRYKRIVALLKKTPKHTFESFAKIQMDLKLPRAERIVPFMLEDLSKSDMKDPLKISAIDALKKWDFMADKNSVATTLFYTIYKQAMRLAIEDELPKRALGFFISQRYSTNLVDQWFEDPGHIVWDHRGTPGREVRTIIVRKAFENAIKELSKRFGSKLSDWTWGKAHQMNVKHPFGKKKALAKLFNLPTHQVGGGLDSIWKSHFDMGRKKNPFKPIAGPVYRMLVDLNDLSKSKWVIDTGSSGWPGSPHYSDQFHKWKKGEFIPMLSNAKDIEKNTVGIWKFK